MKKWLALASMLVAESAMACPVCFGDPNSNLTKGAANAVWFLIGVVALVQIGFISLFVSFWRRARAMRRVREQLHVIQGGVP